MLVSNSELPMLVALTPVAVSRIFLCAKSIAILELPSYSGKGYIYKVLVLQQISRSEDKVWQAHQRQQMVRRMI